jgi:hypothetical protein
MSIIHPLFSGRVAGSCGQAAGCSVAVGPRTRVPTRCAVVVLAVLTGCGGEEPAGRRAQETTPPPQPAAIAPQPAVDDTAAQPAPESPPAEPPSKPKPQPKPAEPALPPEELEAAITAKLTAAERLAERARFDEAVAAAREAERIARGGARAAECKALVATYRDQNREATALSFAVAKIDAAESAVADVAARELFAGGETGMALLREIVRQGSPTALERAVQLLDRTDSPAFIGDLCERLAAETDPQVRAFLKGRVLDNVNRITPAQVAALARQYGSALGAEAVSADRATLDGLDVLLAVYAGPAGAKAEAFDAMADRPGLEKELKGFISRATDSENRELARWAGPYGAGFGLVLDFPALALWLRADKGVEATADGTVESWADLAPRQGEPGAPPVKATAAEPASRPQLVDTDRGPAVKFDGANDYLRLPPGYAAFPEGLSIVAIVQPTGVGRWARVIDFGSGPEADNIALGFGDPAGILGLLSCPKGTRVAVGGPNSSVALTEKIITPGRWLHLTASIDPAGKAAIFMDGKPVAAGPVPAMREAVRERCFIGQSNWNQGPGVGPDAMLAGLLKELRFYRRVLTPDEIAADAKRSLPAPRP